ncbi:MAG: DNA polymerase III subunit delta [Bacteroidota bacterium]
MDPQFQTIFKEIKKGKFEPVYLLHGDEPFFIDKIANEIENTALNIAERSFNQNILFGKDITVGALIGYARGFPMMGDRQVIIVKEAQQINGFDNKENAKLLEQYFLNPQASTILVICFYENIDERKGWVKAVAKNGISYKSKKFYDNKLPDWVLEYCHAQKLKISYKAIQLLIDFIGNDLTRMASEIDKLMLNLKINEEISATTIEKYVGISKEYNIFEFQKALIQRDVVKANNIALYFSKNQKQNPLAATIVMLYSLFTKILLVHVTSNKSDNNLAPILGISPYFAKDYVLAGRNYSYPKTFEVIHYIKQAELNSKGIDSGSQTEKNILQELIYKILH